MRDSTPNITLPTFTKRVAPLSLTLISCSLLVSCGNFSATNLAKKSMHSVKSVANLVPRRIPVAEVRTKELQKMPSGADRALAWNRHLDAKRYATTSYKWFNPKNYKPASLPDERSMPMDGGILPPLKPGQGSTLEGRGDIETH